MNCEEAREWLPAYADRELDAMRTMEMERHLEECAQCREAADRMAALGEAVRTHAPYHRAPVGLESRLRERLRLEPRAKADTSRWRGWAIAASVVLAVALGYSAREIQARRSAGELMAREAVSAHVRSLMANHLIDVPSSDQHTVKPWFNGKLDFSPPVKDFTSAGFTLEGGRLDYLNGRPAAAIVYRRRQHAINLFIMPAASGPPPAQSTAWNGYNVVGWEAQGMRYWAVSDLNAAELAEFARLAG
jgi:anti-sigma factor (TIGR02949 family)